MLAEVDQKIVGYIKEHGPASAEAIQTEFKYKGRNAACARLSKLAMLGKLVKQRAGKVIYYAHPEDQTGRGD
jgi:predicted HTH transcriptional regulator